MVALCLDDGEMPTFHEDDVREAQKLVEDMDDSVLSAISLINDLVPTKRSRTLSLWITSL